MIGAGLNGLPVSLHLLGDATPQVGTQVAEITKPLASVDRMVASGMMVIMHRSGAIAKRLGSDTERKIRDLVKSCKGSEIVFERSGGSFAFEIGVKSEGKDWHATKKTVKASTRSMKVDGVVGVPSYCDAIWEEV